MQPQCKLSEMINSGKKHRLRSKHNFRTVAEVAARWTNEQVEDAVVYGYSFKVGKCGGRCFKYPIMLLVAWMQKLFWDSHQAVPVNSAVNGYLLIQVGNQQIL